MNAEANYVFTILPLLIFALLPIATALWAYGDAQRRGKPGCLVALMVLLCSWPIGLILWIVFRPAERRDY